MKELVTVEQAERVLRLLAVALPLAGLVIGAVVGAMRGRARRGLVIGLVIGHTGPATFVLWKVYNGIMARYGLDSVKGLLLNLALFVAVGLAVGLVVGWRLSRPPKRVTSQESASTGRG
jgi:hypothetical protein